MKIAVVIPSYHREQQLSRLLEQLAALSLDSTTFKLDLYAYVQDASQTSMMSLVALANTLADRGVKTRLHFVAHKGETIGAITRKAIQLVDPMKYNAILLTDDDVEVASTKNSIEDLTRVFESCVLQNFALVSAKLYGVNPDLAPGCIYFTTLPESEPKLPCKERFMLFNAAHVSSIVGEDLDEFAVQEDVYCFFKAMVAGLDVVCLYGVRGWDNPSGLVDTEQSGGFKDYATRFFGEGVKTCVDKYRLVESSGGVSVRTKYPDIFDPTEDIEECPLRPDIATYIKDHYEVTHAGVVRKAA